MKLSLNQKEIKMTKLTDEERYKKFVEEITVSSNSFNYFLYKNHLVR